MPFSSDLILPAVERYRRERDRYVKLADRVAEICRTEVCEQNAIRAQVTFRVKSLKSFEGKLHRFSGMPDRNYKVDDDIFSSISDLAGVRIAAYQHEDCEKLKHHLLEVFRGPAGGDVPVDIKDHHKDDPQRFYRAIHGQVCLPIDELVGTYDNVDDISCEVQICTMMAHVWNEVEHDIGYKPDGVEPTESEKRLLLMLGHTVRAGDEQISMLLAANMRRVGHEHEPRQGAHPDQPERAFRDVHDFVSRMQDYENQAMPEFAKYSGQLFDLLTDLKINSPSKLIDALRPFNVDALKNLANDFSEHLEGNDLDGLAPDSESSDLILLCLLERKLTQILGIHKGRAGRGRGRPTRLHRMAKHYQSWKDSER